jgi:dipeptidyl aminopeptidase/acylaminoacyl peptidase
VLDQAEVWSFGLDLGAPPARFRLDPGTADFVFDPCPMPNGSGVAWQAWNVPDMPWDASRLETAALDGSVDEALTADGALQQPRFLPDGRLLCVRDDTGWLNVWLGDEPLVDEPFEHAAPTWGAGQRSFAVSPDGDRVAFTRNELGFGRVCVVDVETRAVTEIGRGVHGQLSWCADSLTALRTGACTPTQIVRYDTASWHRTVLAVGPVAGWETADLPEPEPLEVEHDGTRLHARRYVAGRGRTLCWIHGGPTDQWQVEFMPRIAYWWSQGWDVLVPDPRGSTGHGRAYQQALRGEWGRRDVDDAAAVLAASHASRASTPQATVMMGSSSGGLTALGVLGRHSGLAVGGVVLYPVADLAVLAHESHRFEAHYTLGLVGPLDDHDLYRARSPVSYAGDIDVPVLVMHGDDDPVVPLSSTVDFVELMRAAGRDVELIVMEGEGHGFRDPVNKRAEYERTAEFLLRVVGDG